MDKILDAMMISVAFMAITLVLFMWAVMLGLVPIHCG